MVNQTVLSRKIFFRTLAGLGTGLFFWIWNRLSVDQSGKENQVEFRHGKDIPMGVSYFGKYYLYRKEDIVIAFSTICTHAGCRIGKTNGVILQCGCHGSRFEASTGKPLKGPAILPLRELDCRLDSESGQWIVKLRRRNETNG